MSVHIKRDEVRVKHAGSLSRLAVNGFLPSGHETARIRRAKRVFPRAEKYVDPEIPVFCA
jgi:hypothetical protein